MAVEAVGEIRADGRIGVQFDSMPFKKWEYLCGIYGADRLADCEPTLRKVRVFKTAWEIELLRENTRFLEQGMYNTFRQIVPGMSEQEIASIWNRECFALSDEIYNVFPYACRREELVAAADPGRKTVCQGRRRDSNGRCSLAEGLWL